MDNLENLIVLAETSALANNYEQSYLYYSKLLEINSSEYSFWLGKGIAAGWCSTFDNFKLEELTICINQALKNDLNNKINKINLANQIFEICEKLTVKLITSFGKEVNNEFDKKPMATGELYAVHQIGRISIELKNGNLFRPLFIKIIETMEFACELNTIAENYLRIIKVIDKIITHSNYNQNYFQPFGNDLRWKFTLKGRDKYPGFSSKVQPVPQKSGCFIATATLGDYNHPYMLTFRIYRNDVLNNSSYGKIFIKVYYKLSPPIAKIIEKNKYLKVLVLNFILQPINHYLLKKYGKHYRLLDNKS